MLEACTCLAQRRNTNHPCCCRCHRPHLHFLRTPKSRGLLPLPGHLPTLKLSICAWESRAVGTVLTPSAHRPFLRAGAASPTLFQDLPWHHSHPGVSPALLGDEGGAADGTEVGQLCLSCGPVPAGPLLRAVVLVSACLYVRSAPSREAGTADGLPGAAPDGEPQGGAALTRWVPGPSTRAGAALGAVADGEHGPKSRSWAGGSAVFTELVSVFSCRSGTRGVAGSAGRGRWLCEDWGGWRWATTEA